MLLRMCLALFVVAEAWAQPAPRATPPQKGDGPVTRASFTAKGLNSEDDLTDLFVGNFGAVAFDRGSLSFSSLFQAYLEAFSSQCGAYLPPNKVKMTRQVCADPIIQTLPNEPPPPPHPCYSWRTESLGFADPALYAARKQLDVEQGPNQVKDLISMTRSLRPAVGIFQANTDMLALVRINACGGPGLRRFQDNLALFSMGKPPLLLPGEPPPASGSQPPGVLVDSDYSRLVEDLVADEAKVWSVNRYVPGSTSQVIVAHDPTGRPSMIRAKYFFTSLMNSGRMQGSVNVSFTAGMPACIYFSDAPSNCQTPNRRIVAKYSSGGYLNANPSPPGSSPAAAAAVLPPPDRGAPAKVQAQASVCVPGDLVAQWLSPSPGSKMEALQRTLKAALREGTIPAYDQTKWMTVDAGNYSTWNPAGPFRGVVTATDGGRCAVGRHEFLALAP